MAHYAIGDIHGCFDELTALLAQLGFNYGVDTLWLVGDLINRGPQSLACLKWAMRHENCVQMVLGNHDLHLLAVLYGGAKLKKRDTLTEIIRHSKANIMRDWLRAQPLMRQTDTHVLVHAGILPEWSISLAQNLADEVSAHISGQGAKAFFQEMYGDKPDKWSEKWQGMARWRFVTNVFTRMRVLYEDNRLDFDYKGIYQNIQPPLSAWFERPDRQNLDKIIVFGHWSALGFCDKNRVLGLDTGALWGGALTAVNLDTGARFTQDSFQS